ncbi:hypothetical protein Q3G72_016150 [Acer saccharum]|nr:hypothetical protein Q3G72_016150 [Acer saccharum]
MDSKIVLTLKDAEQPPTFDFDCQDQEKVGEKVGWKLKNRERSNERQIGDSGLAHDGCLKEGVNHDCFQLNFGKVVNSLRLKMDKEANKTWEETGRERWGSRGMEETEVEVPDDGGGIAVEEEIARFIETGVSLGFDFGGKEDLIREELRRREVEDEERLKETQLM